MQPAPSRRVLLAFDGSASARRALGRACELAGADGVVTIVHVVPAQAVSSRLVTVTDEERAEQARLLEEAARLVRRAGARAETRAAAGDVFTEILAAAADTEADAIVVGGAGGRQVRLHKPLSRKLVAAAKCDVLVVR
jgi:nucleotide-binding universal stress UspA family protein